MEQKCENVHLVLMFRRCSNSIFYKTTSCNSSEKIPVENILSKFGFFSKLFAVSLVKIVCAPLAENLAVRLRWFFEFLSGHILSLFEIIIVVQKTKFLCYQKMFLREHFLSFSLHHASCKTDGTGKTFTSEFMIRLLPK